MNTFNWKFALFSFVAAVVVLYFVFMNQDGATQQQAIYNSLGGGVGMVLGLYVYSRFNKKDNDSFDLDDK